MIEKSMVKTGKIDSIIIIIHYSYDLLHVKRGCRYVCFLIPILRYKNKTMLLCKLKNNGTLLTIKHLHLSIYIKYCFYCHGH
jgi:hypothetical protein